MSGLIAERILQLDNNIIVFREEGGDRETLNDVVNSKYHLPLYGVMPPGEIILDLGTHIGLTALDFSLKYPGKVIIGAEIDKENWVLSKMNTAIHKNISISNFAITGRALEYGQTSVTYNKNIHGNNAHRIDCNGDCLVEAQNIDTLLHFNYGKIRQSFKEEISYIKMDIEGEELFVLQDGGDWVEKTKSIGVEVHEDYVSINDVANALDSLGFIVEQHDTHPSSLYGLR